MSDFRRKTLKPLRLALGVLACAAVLAGCSGGLSTLTKFSPSKWGAASPRVVSSGNIPKGGGREMVGKPYQVAGRWYTPRVDPGYDRTGLASWYGPNFHGRLTANGEVFDQYAITAAHPTLPLPSYVRVTNLENNRSMIVRVNDRGPFVSDRIIDLSRKSAEMLGYTNSGVARVRVQYVGPAPLQGDDTRILLASLNGPSQLEQGGIAVASAATAKPPRSESALTTLGRIIVNPLSIFAYSDPVENGKSLGAAFEATEAMAVGAELAAWQQGMDIDRRELDVGLGTFADPARADQVARAFALVAAVDAVPVRTGGTDAVELRLSWLKPGATRADVVNLAGSLGLEDVVIPD